MQRLFIPPVVFLILVAAALVLPGPTVVPESLLLIGAAVFFIPGIFLLAAAQREYRQNGSEIHTFKQPRGLTTTGVFRYSRNPMYLGFTLLLLAVAFGVGTVAAFAAPVAFFLLCSLWYIPYEERAAEETFGEPYREYKRKTPRWIGVPAGSSS